MNIKPLIVPTALAAVVGLTGSANAERLPITPSPTNPNSNPATVVQINNKVPPLSPTNPNPPTNGGDQARIFVKPLFAQVPSQIAQRQEQPSNTSSNKRPDENNDTQVVNRQLEQSRQAQIESAQNLRNRKPVPGGE